MKFLRHRRGLSNVVTTAMLLTAVAVLGTGLVGWSHTNLTIFQVGLANTTSTVTNRLNENLAIENVYFCKPAFCSIAAPLYKGVNVTITNIGTLAVNVTQIQVNSTSYIHTSCCRSVILYPQQSYTYPVTQATWNSKSVSTITVTTARGSIVTTQAAAP